MHPEAVQRTGAGDAGAQPTDYIAPERVTEPVACGPDRVAAGGDVVWLWAGLGCMAPSAGGPSLPSTTATDTASSTVTATEASGDTGTGPTTAAVGESALAFLGAPPRHLLMISIDTLRRDQLTRYGGHGNMPFLDGLLDEGVALDDHVACSNWTLHSTVCAMTGTYPELWG